MRLPHYSIHSLSSYTNNLLTIGAAILLIGMMPAIAGASTYQLVCSPLILGFGATVVGQTETLPVTVTNSGESSATISGVTANNSGFTPSSLSLPLTLAPGQSVEMSVSFTPTSIGWAGGTIKFISDAANAILPLEVAGSGVSSENVTASPSTVTFGSSALGTVSTKPIVLTNARPWKVNLLRPPDDGRRIFRQRAHIPVRPWPRTKRYLERGFLANFGRSGRGHPVYFWRRAGHTSQRYWRRSRSTCCQPGKSVFW